MGKKKETPWETEALTLGSFAKPNYTTTFTYNANAGTLYIKSNANRQYHCIQKSWTFVNGYEYKLEYDITYVSGTHMGGARKSNNSMFADSGYVRESKHIIIEFQYNSDLAYITLFDTVSTAETGEMTYSNFSLQRRLIA